jgi:trehalose/maltose transport system substrate-binding protein
MAGSCRSNRLELHFLKVSNCTRGVALPSWPSCTKIAGVLGILLFSLGLNGSRQPSDEPVTIMFLDPEWSHDLSERSVLPDERLQEFTRQTGIRVKHLPAPESDFDQLALTRDLLRNGNSSPDIYGIDVIWPGILSEDLMDLKPYFGAELSSEDPNLLATFVVKGKLVAVPYHINVGVLFYRADLLREYGYRAPPRGWDQLERMAARIQQGQRAKGQADFWGFVWPGAAGENLTCNAMEWQVSEGGGRIIDGDDTISVNNASAIRAWKRAAHWIGWISPPAVTSYQEWDAKNALNSGRAAFWRGWASDYFLSDKSNWLTIRDRIGISSVPGGAAVRVGTLGGFGLGVSRSSAHPREAVELIRFLVQRERQLETARSHSEPPKGLELYELPAVLKAYSQFDLGQHRRGSRVVSRPSSLTGRKYEDVARAYIGAVHSVLTGKSTAPGAAATLEKTLVAITGFKTGPPSLIRSFGNKSTE